jgi:transcriptional regulator with XRE-family HTH domain
MATTLKDLRERAGLTPTDVVARLRGMGPGMPQDRTWVHQIEKRGVSKFSLLRALATIYGVTMDDVERAAITTASLSTSSKLSSHAIDNLSTVP